LHLFLGTYAQGERQRERERERVKGCIPLISLLRAGAVVMIAGVTLYKAREGVTKDTRVENTRDDTTSIG
jgi:hypothetical protein